MYFAAIFAHQNSIKALVVIFLKIPKLQQNSLMSDHFEKNWTPFCCSRHQKKIKIYILQLGILHIYATHIFLGRSGSWRVHGWRFVLRTPRASKSRDLLRQRRRLSLCIVPRSDICHARDKSAFPLGPWCLPEPNAQPLKVSYISKI